jgi:hypothetical protein
MEMCKPMRQKLNNAKTSSAEITEKVNSMKLESDAILEEYRSLKAEIKDRLQSGQQIVNLSIAFSVGVVGFLQFIQNTNTISQSNIKEVVTYAYLIGATISACFGLMYLGDDITIGHLASYINQSLRPKMEALISEFPQKAISIWEWEDFRNVKQFSMPMVVLGALINSSKYILTIIPSILLLVAYFLYRDYSIVYSTLELILLTLVLLIGISTIILMVYEISIYRGISDLKRASKVMTEFMTPKN